MNKNSSSTISPASSALLDFLRLFSALAVLLVHAVAQWFPADPSLAGGKVDIAHFAVVIFFVLSGYVISYTTSVNNRGAMQYAQARLSRLYSVVLPALLVTAVAQLILLHVNPELGSVYSRGLSWQRYFLSGCFLNELWFFFCLSSD